MKKTIILLTAFVAAVGLRAQEVSPWTFTAEVGVGATRFINQPALSLAADATPQYSALTPTAMVGLTRGGNTFGLRYSHTSVNTFATSLREVARLHEVSLLYRRAVQVAPRVELFGGVSAGMAVADNELDLDGQRRTVYRYGLTLGAEVGIRYRINDWAILFATAGVDYTALSKSNISLPADYARQVHGSAAFVRTLGGLSIGIPPKKLRLNMPETLVSNSEPLQLARYDD